jgi:hypothetical protein
MQPVGADSAPTRVHERGPSGSVRRVASSRSKTHRVSCVKTPRSCAGAERSRTTAARRRSSTRTGATRSRPDRFTMTSEDGGGSTNGHEVDARLVTVRSAAIARSSPVGVPLRVHPVELSSDRSRLLVHRGAGRVVDRTSGRTLHRIRSFYRYDAMSIAHDGRSLALVTMRRPTREEVEDLSDPHGSLPTTVALVALDGKRRLHFGEVPLSSVPSP